MFIALALCDQMACDAVVYVRPETIIVGAGLIALYFVVFYSHKFPRVKK